MKNRFFIITLFLLSSVSSFAIKGDTLSLPYRALERQFAKERFLSESFVNPALNHYRYAHSLSSLSVNGQHDDSYAYDYVEQGDGYAGGRVQAQSHYLLTPTSRVWGKAYYERGRHRDVRWNETSDYDKLFPYVAADSVGGDMTTEAYYFKGGYSQKWSRWTFGGEFHYRAQLEFRKVDPRPRNSVAELCGKLSGSFALTDNYILGLSASAQKYKQQGEISFLNEDQGGYIIRHLQGLATSHARFDGSNDAVNHEGRTWRVSFDLLPIKSQGVFATIVWQNQSYEKMLPNLNDITLNTLSETTWQAVLGWHSEKNMNHWGLKALGRYDNRSGIQMIYGDAVSNRYPLLSQAEGYRCKRLSASVSAFWEQHYSNFWLYGADVNIGYFSRDEKQITYSNCMNYQSLDVSLLLTSTWHWKRNLATLRLGAGYAPHLGGEMDIKYAVCPYARQMVEQNFRRQTADKLRYHIQASWSVAVTSKIMLHAGAGWSQQHLTAGPTGRLWTASLGASF